MGLDLRRLLVRARPRTGGAGRGVCERYGRSIPHLHAVPAVNTHIAGLRGPEGGRALTQARGTVVISSRRGLPEHEKEEHGRRQDRHEPSKATSRARASATVSATATMAANSATMMTIPRTARSTRMVTTAIGRPIAVAARMTARTSQRRRRPCQRAVRLRTRAGSFARPSPGSACTRGDRSR